MGESRHIEDAIIEVVALLVFQVLGASLDSTWWVLDSTEKAVVLENTQVYVSKKGAQIMDPHILCLHI